MKVVSSVLAHQPIRPNPNTAPPPHASAPASPRVLPPPHSLQSEFASDQRSPRPAPPASFPQVAEPTETTSHRPDRSVAALIPSPQVTKHNGSRSRESSETSP